MKFNIHKKMYNMIYGKEQLILLNCYSLEFIFKY